MQQQRSWLGLTSRATDLLQPAKVGGITGPEAQRLHPGVGDARQRRIALPPDLYHHVRQRIREILIVAYTKTIARHVDAGPKWIILSVQLDQVIALVRCQDRAQLRIAELPERRFRRLPIHVFQPLSGANGHLPPA